VGREVRQRGRVTDFLQRKKGRCRSTKKGTLVSPTQRGNGLNLEVGSMDNEPINKKHNENGWKDEGRFMPGGALASSGRKREAQHIGQGREAINGSVTTPDIASQRSEGWN